MFQRLLWLAVAGALGTLARYGVGVCVPRVEGGFPWPTLTVNCVGSFLFGCVWTLADQRSVFSPDVRLAVLTGFLGAFTTFSAFAFETGHFLRHEQYGNALANVLANNVLGILLFFLGYVLCRNA